MNTVHVYTYNFAITHLWLAGR